MAHASAARFVPSSVDALPAPRPATGCEDILRRNAVTVTGPEGAPTVVLAHGFGCDQTMWRHVAPLLAVDHRVVSFDYVGASDLSCYDPVRYASLDGYAKDLAEVLEALDLRGAVVVGHSVSGMISVRASLLVPDRIGALVMIAPSPRYLDDDGYRGGFSEADVEGLLEVMASNYLGWAEGLAPAVMANADRPELREELHESFLRTDHDVARQFARATFFSDTRSELHRVSVPTLVVQALEDVIVPPEVSTYLCERIPHCELVLLDARGHYPHLSAPEETAGVVREFLARHLSASPGR
ncbi:MAG: alpha/beta fold hydrolase [Motilibacteraceae bacterium]